MKLAKRSWAEIDLDAMAYNTAQIKKLLGDVKLAAVVKADAYGHGDALCAPVIDAAGADVFAVSNIVEARRLRAAGIKKPVLILGYTPPEIAEELRQYDITQTVFSLEYAKRLSDNLRGELSVHIKVDTGMNRLGFHAVRDTAQICTAAALPNIKVDGIFTHFALSDGFDDFGNGYTEMQFERFISTVKELQLRKVEFGTVHCCNSAAALLRGEMRLDMARVGIALYGITPCGDIPLPIELKSVMKLKSVVSFVKTVAAGERIGYGCTYTAKGEMRVATVPLGYADGYHRALSNRGEIEVRGKRARIVGNICMDQLMLDVSGIEGVCEGDEVTAFGGLISANEVAERADTISYEMVCAVARRVPRVYISNGVPLEVIDYSEI